MLWHVPKSSYWDDGDIKTLFYYFELKKSETLLEYRKHAIIGQYFDTVSNNTAFQTDFGWSTYPYLNVTTLSIIVSCWKILIGRYTRIRPMTLG